MDTILVRKQIPTILSYSDIKTLTVKKQILTITIYDDTRIEPPATYIDAGFYNENGVLVDAGFYNTSSWEEIWDAKYS